MENVFCNEKYIEYSLLNYAAPVLEKQKPAGLLTIWKYHLDDVSKQKLRHMGGQKYLQNCRIEILVETNLYFLLLCYQEELLEQVLEKNKESSLLREYATFQGVQERLNLIKDKLMNYNLGTGDFPHEVGLFLGYPIWDVKGFIDHNGQDYQLCGYWKVYDDVPGAILKFEKFDAIRKHAMEQFYRKVERNNHKL